jgi:CubicO group peptidase (beta-lactamase class C family)
MLRQGALAAIVAGVALAAAPRAQEPASTPDFSAIRAYIQEAVATGKTPSLSLAVLYQGRLVWTEAYGEEDLE